MKTLEKTSWLLAGRVVGDGLGLVFYLFLARRFGEAGIGDYSFAFAVAALFGLAVEFGLRPLLTRRIARDPDAAAAQAATVISLQLGLAVAAGLLLHVVGRIAGYSGQLHLLLLLAFAGLALRALAGSFVAFLEGVEAMDRSAMLEVVARATTALVGLALVFGGVALEVVLLAHVLGGFAQLAVAFVWVRRRFGRLEPVVDPRLAAGTLMAALPFVGAAVLYELYARVDILMLHRMVGEVATGEYAVPVRIISSLTVVASLTGVAAYPTLSRETHGEVAARDALFRSTLRWLGLLGMAAAVCLVVGGPDLVPLLFGDEFADSGRLLRWMSVVFFAEFVRVPYWRLLFAIGREGLVLRLQGVSVVINIGLNLLLIPRFGALGAVWASITSEVFLAAAYHAACSRIVSAPYSRMGVRLLLVGSLATGAGLYLGRVTPWTVATAIALAVFLMGALVAGLFSRRDWATAAGLLRRSGLPVPGP